MKFDIFIWAFKSGLSQVLSVTNIVHTIVIVLPTLFINFFGGAIAKFIDDQEVEFEHCFMALMASWSSTNLANTKFIDDQEVDFEREIKPVKICKKAKS